MGILLRGEARPISLWTQQWDWRRVGFHTLIITAGAGLYGAAMGWWRAPEQAVFTAIKFPLIVMLTTLANALLNGMLAPLLGLNIPLRQSFLAVLTSFAIIAAILGSFSPLAAFVVWNAPPLESQTATTATYILIKFMHVVVIAFAGIAGNVRLFQLLLQLSGNRVVATRVLFAWLTGNLFFGSQLSWILRPFIGTPSMPVQFFRAEALHGNFYENLFHELTQLIAPD